MLFSGINGFFETKVMVCVFGGMLGYRYLQLTNTLHCPRFTYGGFIYNIDFVKNMHKDKWRVHFA